MTISQRIDFESALPTHRLSLNRQLVQKAKEKLDKRPFLYIQYAATRYIAFDLANSMLWLGNLGEYSLANANTLAGDLSFLGIKDWRLPNFQELEAFVKHPKNPMRSGSPYRLFGYCYWLCADKGRVDIDSSCFTTNRGANGNTLCCKPIARDEFANTLLQLQQQQQQPRWDSGLASDEQILLDQYAQTKLGQALTELDYDACRLPRLKPDDWSDPARGLWEAWGQPEEQLTRHGIRARNPALDLRDGYVAIDFGTSSTVVAWMDGNTPALMRVGAKDFFAPPKMGDYENPTVLELLDLPALLQAWQARAYQPDVRWLQVRCAHEALHNWRHNETNSTVVGSVLSKIKQWALRSQADVPVRVTDQNNQYELELPALTIRNPVLGQPLSVSQQDPFDPIELYAWFLGMTINWRGRGIFMRYAMTFPVEYPRAVRDSILASFRRGLQRSLPATLAQQSEQLALFEVKERASEPAAYAAAALPELGIEPGESHTLGYAVFDFGGGTTDFDFGFYRLPTEAEGEAGIEVVLERCGNAGDRFLGGENLLEHLAWRTFRHNEALCREKKIVFTRPLDAQGFAGDELLVEKTRAATTNTLMLMSRLRPLWEQGQLPDSSSGVISLDLLTREGTRSNCELAVDQDDLLNWLKGRLRQGVENFYTALKKSFAHRMPQHLHVLLAGNSSRSHMVAELFGLSQAKAPSHKNNRQSIEVKIPQLADSSSNAKLLQWNKKVGEIVITDEYLVDIETDKAMVEVTAPSAGVLVEILEGDGAAVTSGQVIARITPADSPDTSEDGGNPKAETHSLDNWRQTLLEPNAPVFTIHPPLAGKADDLYAPTGKTGVALGLLKLCPGSAIEVTDMARSQPGDESPFAWYVGAARRGVFHPVLRQGADYHQWQALGVPRDRAYNLLYTQSPQANEGNLPADAPGLYRRVLHLGGDDRPNVKVFARAVAPNCIEVCTATSADDPDRTNLQTLTLKA